MRNRTWWRNLRGGAAVSVRLQGQQVSAWGEVSEDQESTRSALDAYFTASPNFAKYLDVALDADGQPDPGDIARVAQSRVMVKLKLDE